MRLRRLLGTIAVASLAALLGACSLFGRSADRDAAGQITAAGQVDVFSFAVGDCVDTAKVTDGNSEVSDVPATPCNEPHDSEVIALFNITSLTDYDEDAVLDQADEGCEAAMGEYVGPNWEDLGLWPTYLYPTEETWATGDREVVCLAETDTPPLTQSIRGTGR